MSQANRNVVRAYELGFYFDFNTHELVRPTGYRRKEFKLYGKQRYPVDAFIEDGRSRSFKIHRLAAYQIFGSAIFRKGLVVRHLDDNPLNISYENLSVGTVKDNSCDVPVEIRSERLKHARSFQKRPPTCDTEDDVVKNILKDYFQHVYMNNSSTYGLVPELAKRYGKTKSCIESIVHGKSFKDIYQEVKRELSIGS
ncbi:hypothetical protein Mithridates_00115 [Acinetobacter phage Mithridates]|nr:hypothetical protein Mithridates_00115 [Acinetobacter phage Mithridates]